MSIQVKAQRVIQGATKTSGKPKTDIFDGQKYWHVFGHNDSIQPGSIVLLKPSGIANWYEFEFTAEQVSGKQSGGSQSNGAQQAKGGEPTPPPMLANTPAKPTLSAILSVIPRILAVLPDWSQDVQHARAYAQVINTVIMGIEHGSIVIDPDYNRPDGGQQNEESAAAMGRMPEPPPWERG